MSPYLLAYVITLNIGFASSNSNVEDSLLDPVTQGALGAAASLALARFKPRLQAKAPVWELALIGALAGMAPDLDILIRSQDDPLLALQYHRHFTHALIFAPLGGLIVGTVYHWLRRGKIPIWTAIIFASVGWASHGPLDAFTSYGTLLYWPFSEQRVAWNWIAIIDLAVTIPLLLGVALTIKSKQLVYNLLGLLLACCSIALGGWQNHRVSQIQYQLAEQRGHHIERAALNPTIGNLLLWRSYYQSEGRLWADAIRLGLDAKVQIWEGDSLPLFDKNAALQQIPADSVLAEDLNRFHWFTDGYLAAMDDTQIGDFRYGLLPQDTTPLWGIRFDLEQSGQRVERVSFTSRRRDSVNILWNMMLGKEPGATQWSYDPR